MATEFSYYKIGEGGWEGITIELFEWAEFQPAVRNFRIYDEVHSIAKTDEFHPCHIPASVQLTIKDVDGYYYDKMDGKPGNTFMIKCTENSAVYFTGYVINPSAPKAFLKYYDKLTLVANDGVKALDLQANTYTSKIQLGTLFFSLLADTGLEFNLNVLFNYTHFGASGFSANSIQQLRIDPSYYLEGLDQPSKYDLLTRILADFKLQLFQENGEWWLMQRDLRTDVAALVWTYNGTSWLSDPVTIQKAITVGDLREQDDNLRANFAPVKSVERIANLPKPEFAFENALFESWSGGEADGWSGVGAVTQLTSPSRLQFNSVGTLRSQIVRRPVMGGDVFQFYAKIEYDRASGLANGSYTIGLGEIKAVATNGESDLYLKEDGTWTTSPTQVSRTFSVLGGVPGAYEPVDVDIETIIPPGFIGYIVATMKVTGDTSAMTSGASPRYGKLYLESRSLSMDIPNHQYSSLITPLNGGEAQEEDVYGDDVNPYAPWPAREYYNGSSWLPASDFSSDGSNMPLSEVVLASYLKSASEPIKKLQLRLPFTFALKMHQTILYNLSGTTYKFIPIGYYRYRKARQIIIHCSQLFSSGTVLHSSGYKG